MCIRDRTDIKEMEKIVTECLTTKKIDATIHASIPLKNGDVILKFDKKDDIKTIAKHIGNELHMKAYGK